MKLLSSIFALAALSLLTACGGGSSAEEPTALTPSMLKATMLESIAQDSVDCGEVDISNGSDDDVMEVSQCAFDAYTLNQPFHFFYRSDGIKSAAYEGYVYNGQLFYTGLYWDPDERPPIGEILVEQCADIREESGRYFRFSCAS